MTFRGWGGLSPQQVSSSEPCGELMLGLVGFVSRLTRSLGFFLGCLENTIKPM